MLLLCLESRSEPTSAFSDPLCCCLFHMAHDSFVDCLFLLVLLDQPSRRPGPPCQAMLQPIQGTLHSYMLMKMPWILMDVPRLPWHLGMNLSSLRPSFSLPYFVYLIPEVTSLVLGVSDPSLRENLPITQAHDIEAYKPECNSLIKNETEVCQGEQTHILQPTVFSLCG